jgi:5-methylcytosine-specific restriction endonuclease McrA
MSKKSIARNRARAFEAQSHRCIYCSVVMWMTDGPAFASAIGATHFSIAELQCTAEHGNARCDGGKDCRQNIFAACRRCNRLRHARKKPLSVEAFKAYVRSRIRSNRWHAPWVFALRLVSAT